MAKEQEKSVELVEGMRVLYVPHEDHFLDTDHDGKHVFHFVHVESPQHGKQFAGQSANMNAIGSLQSHMGAKRMVGGGIETMAGHRVRHAGPKFYWPATVVQVPPLTVYVAFTKGSDVAHLIDYPVAQLHAGMTLTCLTSELTATVDKCLDNNNFRLNAAATMGGHHLVRFDNGGWQLNIRHPSGINTLHYRIDNGPNPVRFDNEKRHHTFHLES